ncbi:sensor histidine kinase N-terminal domain-containing protein [Xylophilus sp. GOD-11R]|nr:sensor histidine kinase N-terminal domain-containing protein [Xylophilus sp. GOD-11R]WPB59540.1 sensor histidine kinase N-terminal domain-containing protein [Xylophilus sp. GOD-11R]
MPAPPPVPGLPSLRTRVLQHVLVPLALAWLLGVVVSIAVAINFTQRAFDRALLDDAYSVAANVHTTGEELELGLSPREVGAVLFDQSERIYFAVLWPDGTLLAGHGGLHAPPPEDGARYRFSDISYQGRPLRAVLLRTGRPQPFDVVMAETTQSRATLLRSLLLYAIAPQLVLLVGLAVWMGRAVARDVRPLQALQETLDTRSASDLSPVRVGGSTREVRRLGDALDSLFARVGAGVRAQREFAGNVAHELRTPLAGIRALAEYGLAQQDPAAWREQLERIARSEERASRLVDQLLALARADEAPVMRFEPIALDEIARDAVLRFLSRADSAGVDLGARGLDEAVEVLGHAALIDGIVNNLIDNALRYGKPADGSQPRITVAVTAEPDSDEVRLTVVDNGPGISVEQQGRLRQRWAQGPEGAWLKQGAGLGLSIVARYAQLLDAQLLLEPAAQHPGLAASVILRRPPPLGSTT